VTDAFGKAFLTGTAPGSSGQRRFFLLHRIEGPDSDEALVLHRFLADLVLAEELPTKASLILRKDLLL
jgi:hypothetical protein